MFVLVMVCPPVVDALLHHATACRSTAKALHREIKLACRQFQSVAINWP
jgi:hypothetical protein